jgi:hypothetical protein
MKHAFIIIFLLVYQTDVKSQIIIDTIILKEKLGITNFYLGNNILEKNSNELLPPFSKHTETRFVPIKIKYVLSDYNLSFELFKKKRIFINTDSTATITSIIFELKNSDKVIKILTNMLGKMTTGSNFRIGNSGSYCKGWVAKNMSIMLLSIGDLELIIFFDGNNRDLMR